MLVHRVVNVIDWLAGRGVGTGATRHNLALHANSMRNGDEMLATISIRHEHAIHASVGTPKREWRGPGALGLIGNNCVRAGHRNSFG